MTPKSLWLLDALRDVCDAYLGGSGPGFARDTAWALIAIIDDRLAASSAATRASDGIQAELAPSSALPGGDAIWNEAIDAAQTMALRQSCALVHTQRSAEWFRADVAQAIRSLKRLTVSAPTAATRTEDAAKPEASEAPQSGPRSHTDPKEALRNWIYAFTDLLIRDGDKIACEADRIWGEALSEARQEAERLHKELQAYRLSDVDTLQAELDTARSALAAANEQLREANSTLAHFSLRPGERCLGLHSTRDALKAALRYSVDLNPTTDFASAESVYNGLQSMLASVVETYRGFVKVALHAVEKDEAALAAATRERDDLNTSLSEQAEKLRVAEAQLRVLGIVYHWAPESLSNNACGVEGAYSELLVGVTCVECLVVAEEVLKSRAERLEAAEAEVERLQGNLDATLTLISNSRAAGFARGVEESAETLLRTACSCGRQNKCDACADAHNIRSLSRAPAKEREPRELLCMRCGVEHPVWFAPNDVWNAVMRRPDGREASERMPFVCPTCFVVLGEEAGIETTGWCVMPAEFPQAQAVYTDADLQRAREIARHQALEPIAPAPQDAAPPAPGGNMVENPQNFDTSEGYVQAANISGRTHDLKTWPEYFDDVASGRKPFELRRNDRDFRAGDTLRLREWESAVERYTGREVIRRVTYVLAEATGDFFGLQPGFAILGLAAPEGTAGDGEGSASRPSEDRPVGAAEEAASNPVGTLAERLRKESQLLLSQEIGRYEEDYQLGLLLLAAADALDALENEKKIVAYLQQHSAEQAAEYAEMLEEMAGARESAERHAARLIEGLNEMPHTDNCRSWRIGGAPCTCPKAAAEVAKEDWCCACGWEGEAPDNSRDFTQLLCPRCGAIEGQGLSQVAPAEVNQDA